jgi:hypothetical protein
MNNEPPIIGEIAANQDAYEDAARSWKRLVPFWLIRTRYRLVKANVPLWEQLGVVFPPMKFETERGISWSIIRMILGAKRVDLDG